MTQSIARIPTGRNPIRSRVRALLRHAALDGLSVANRRNTAEGLRRARVHLPYLHTVPPPEESLFRELVAELAVDHEFVSYSEAVRRITEGPMNHPTVSFSFDDGFASNVRAAAILEEFGTVGMFFVPPGFIGTANTSDARRFFGYSDGVDEPAMTWDDLGTLISRGHEVGNHTWSHHVLSELSDSEVHDEIARGAEELRSRLGICDHFAWPRGRFFHFSATAAQIVFQTGHQTCASAERGAHTAIHAGGPGSLCLRRDHIMTNWPLRHSRYFLGASSRRADTTSGRWPAGWEVAR